MASGSAAKGTGTVGTRDAAGRAATVQTGAGGAQVTVAQAAAAALGWIVLTGLTAIVVIAAEPSRVRLAAAAIVAMAVGAATLVVVGTTLLAARPAQARGDSRRTTVSARELPDPLGARVELERAAAAHSLSARELELSLEAGVKRYEPAG
jgi:hypothetical protein